MSLISFKSPTQGSVIMFGADAKQLLASLNLTESGEIMAAELPALIAQLEKIIETDKVANPVIWPEDLDVDAALNTPITIHLAQRAIPLLRLLKRCLATTETVQWP